MYMVSEIFDLKGRFISKVLRKKKNCILFILIFSIIYILSSTLVLNFYDIKKIQILNFLFSFLIIFEICLKISQSERFILWIEKKYNPKMLKEKFMSNRLYNVLVDRLLKRE